MTEEEAKALLKRTKKKKTKALVVRTDNIKARRPRVLYSKARTRLGRWRKVFLDELTKTPSVTHAAKAARVTRRTAYNWRQSDPEFAERWDDALAESIDALEHQVYQRALTDDAQLAMFLLKAHRPSLYRENVRHEVGFCGVLLLPQKEELPP